jgi:hypothetical protein
MLEGSEDTGYVRDVPSEQLRLPTAAAWCPSLPFSSASFSYPIGASSLYGPLLAVNLTFVTSSICTGTVMVSVADGAILYFDYEGVRFENGSIFSLVLQVDFLPFVVYILNSSS